MDESFGQKLNETIAAQLNSQLLQMQAALKAQNDRMDALNQQLTQQLNPSLGGTSVSPGLSAEEWAFVKLLRDNAKFKEAVQALAKGWAPAPASAGGVA